MASLYLSDTLKRLNIEPKRTKLIRHSLNDDGVRKCYEKGFLDIYQSIQSRNFFRNCDFVCSFKNEPGTSAKFIGCYEVVDSYCKSASKVLMP